MSDWAWLKATLPCCLGGLNLRSASLHAPAAFLASSSEAQCWVECILGSSSTSPPHTMSTVAALASSASRPDWVRPEDIDLPLRQLSLSQAIDNTSHRLLVSSATSIRSRALALSSSLPHAGDWLNVIPSSSLGLHLQDQEFKCCLRYWLGVPLHSNPYPCPECSATADPFGDHQVGCGGNGDRISRHNAVRDVIFAAAQSAAL